MKPIVIAADIGGTNLRVATVDPAGVVHFRTRCPTPNAGGVDEIVRAVTGLVHECGHRPGAEDFVGFGIAVPAVLDQNSGRIHKSPNLPILDGTDLARMIGEELELNVFLENDANAAAIGENWIGASRGAKTSVCATLGTGVGGGLIIDGKPYRGIDGTAGEVGHICVEPLGVECGCGSNGCLEQYASARAIVRMAGELSSVFPGSVLHKGPEITSASVFEAGKCGDPLAVEVFRRVGQYLGIAFAGLVNVLDPEMIVVGGGVSAGWELFNPALRSELEKRAFQLPVSRVKLVRAELGDNSGILGAAWLVFNAGSDENALGA
jgi:glucokinase